jgi:anaerobic ribonucleoside-triphosphate reductase activating protein
MLIHAQIDASRVNGPGRRSVLFAQGCLLDCPSCWAKSTHPFTGTDRSVDDLADWLLRLNRDTGIEGITFSGGEPMHQIDSLCELADRVHAAAPGLSFGMFSGYYERELDTGRYWTRTNLTADDRSRLWRRLCARLDFAVLGRYLATRATHAPLRNSANQSLRLFTARYTDADIAQPEIEITIDPAGLVQLTGFPTAGIPA